MRTEVLNERPDLMCSLGLPPDPKTSCCLVQTTRSANGNLYHIWHFDLGRVQGHCLGPCNRHGVPDGKSRLHLKQNQCHLKPLQKTEFLDSSETSPGNWQSHCCSSKLTIAPLFLAGFNMRNTLWLSMPRTTHSSWHSKRKRMRSCSSFYWSFIFLKQPMTALALHVLGTYKSGDDNSTMHCCQESCLPWVVSCLDM